MVCFARSNKSNFIQGGGILDVMLKPFTVNKYDNERHARSLDPNHFLQGYCYVGPKSELLLRKNLHDGVPLNDLDNFAKQPDNLYFRENKNMKRSR